MIVIKHFKRPIIIKHLKNKDKEKLKAEREKWHITFKGKAISTTVDFSSEIMEA